MKMLKIENNVISNGDGKEEVSGPSAMTFDDGYEVPVQRKEIIGANYDCDNKATGMSDPSEMYLTLCDTGSDGPLESHKEEKQYECQGEKDIGPKSSQ